MIRKILIFSIAGLFLLMIALVAYQLSPFKSAVKFYAQVTQERVRSDVDLQPVAQKGATYVGSKTCAECHPGLFHVQHNSMHPKMIQDVKADPSVIIADFATLPDDASFKLDDVIYTIGSKFKQRFMVRKDTPGKEGYPEENYIIGNYQWNTETGKWQSYKTNKDWYHDAWPDDQSQIFTSHACDGCHFTGFNSQNQRIEPGVNCENCHGPGSVHALSGSKDTIYLATNQDPQRAMEVCIQCHMRNVDKKLEDPNVAVSNLYEQARDYPYGYEPGMALADYKLQAPFKQGVEDSKFYANGIGKKNRMQGNDYVQSTMYKHGITCMNCHNPHSADNTAENPRGAEACMECHSFGSPVGPHQSSAFAHSRHESGPDAPDCIDCHMPQVGKHTGKSPHTVRTHIFRFIYPQETIDYGIPNACSECHGASAAWAKEKMNDWGMTTWERH